MLAIAGEHDGDAVLAGQGDELGRAEAGVPDLECVADRAPSTVRGSSRRKPATSSRSSFFVGMSCQLIGPSLSFNSMTPLLKKRSIVSPASPSTRRFVA